jgi:membrane-associated phospholipid phosphatase
MITAWSSYLSERNNKLRLLISVSAAFLVLFVFMRFLTFNEARTGYGFDDPFLKYLSPRDLSSVIFIITYGLSLAGLFLALQKPELFLLLVASYSVMTLIRMCCLFILPLEPPSGIIPLRDILLQNSFYSGRENLRDLFFSGHTAALLLFAFSFRDLKLKIIFISGAILVGLLLMIQHVHFSMDVLAAGLAAWLSVKFSALFFK